MRRLISTGLLCATIACSSSPSSPAADAGLNPDGGAPITDAGPNGTDAGTVDAGWPYDCPLEACVVEDKSCLAFADHSQDETSLLRISQLTISKPSVLTDGFLGLVVNNSIMPDAPDCSLNGSGQASWLMEFDTTSESPLVKTGSGRLNNVDGTYSYIDENVTFGNQFVPVQPRTMALSLGESGQFETTETADLNIMVADNTGEALAMLPLQGVRLSGNLSANRNCIGRYQADQFSTDDACEPPNGVLFFEEGGEVQGFISLEAADDLFLLGQSLCVILSGDANMYGNGHNPVQCARDGSGNILFQGDWCSDTNAAAAGDCADGVRLEGTFAASAVPAGE